ncbi:MAG: beta-phosphoglucomutase [Bacteroidales bacterium]|nr:beta-phosphoglucomutase [Bacteroidales bacterium]
MISACIFDLDGVIVDTAKFHFIAWRELAQKLGFNFTEKDNEKLKGVSRMRSLDILLEVGGLNFDKQKKLELATEKNDRYVELIKTLTPADILPGVLDFLTDLKTKNYKIALGSASKNAMTILQNINLVDFFDAIIDGTKISKAKPDPEVFLLGATEINKKPEECIVFEDAQAGIEAAKSAKMYAIGIGKTENLKGADIILNDFLAQNIDNLTKKLTR